MAETTEPEPNDAAAWPPDSIIGAWQAWLVAWGLQALAAASMMVMNLRDPGAVMNQAEGGGAFADTYADLTGAQMEGVAQAASVVALIITLLILGLFVWLTFRMRAGRAWARLILVAGSIYLAIGAILLLFGATTPVFESAPSWLQLIYGGLSIAAACAAIAGLILTSGRDSIQWFGPAGGLGKKKQEEQSNRQ